MTDPVDERMDDRMDQRLLAAARSWQAEQPAPAAVPLDRLEEPRPRKLGRRTALAAAAAVVLVGGTGIGLLRTTGGGADSPSSPPPSSPSTHGTRVVDEVVAWRPLKATHPDIRHRSHGTIVTPYDGLVATGSMPRLAHSGDTLRFVVTLESYQGVVLDPCPDFDVAFGRHASYQYALNCAQVPYRARTRGHLQPALPALHKVHFAMEIPVPDVHGKQKVLWTIDGPQSAPGFYGIVRVTPRP